MTRTLVFYAAIAPALCGCIAPEICTDDFRAEALPSSSARGEQTFTEAGEEGSVRFRATLRGLSELWLAEHPVFGASLSVVVHLDYADESQTGGVATQMPRFGVTLANAASTETSWQVTPPFPPTSGIRYATALFTACYDGYEDYDDYNLNCCEYGSTECSLDLLLRYQRQEGDPFPQVMLRWEASAQASVNTCPLSENAELVFEVVEP